MVVPRPKPPPGRCEVLGMVDSKAVSPAGWISRDDLIKKARIDLRNKAGELGATHVFIENPDETYPAHKQYQWIELSGIAAICH